MLSAGYTEGDLVFFPRVTMDKGACVHHNKNMSFHFLPVYFYRTRLVKP